MNFLEHLHLPKVSPQFADKYLRFLSPSLVYSANLLLLPILRSLETKAILDLNTYANSTFPISTINTVMQDLATEQADGYDTALNFVQLTSRNIIGNKEANRKVSQDMTELGYKHNSMLDSIFAVNPGKSTMLFTKDKQAVLITNAVIDEEMIAKLVSLIPYIIGATSLPPKVEQMCIALGAGKYTDYAKLYREWYDSEEFDLLGELLEIVNAAITSNRSSRLAVFQKELDNANANYENLTNQLANTLQNIRMCTTKLKVEMLSQEDNTAVKELLDYIKQHKRSSLLGAAMSGTKLTLTLASPAIYFDSDLLENLLSSGRANCFRRNKTIQAMSHHLFIKQDYQLLMAGTFILDLQANTIAVKTHSPDMHIDNYYLNPHLNHYACMGQNKANILNALHNNDYIMMYENMLASIGGLNFADSPPMDKLANFLTGVSPATCIINPAGKRITPAQFAKELEDETNRTEQVPPAAAAEEVVEELPVIEL